MVVPARGAKACTQEIFISEVDLGQYIETIGDDVTFIEFAIRFVRCRRIHDAIVLVLHPYAQVVPHRVVPAQPVIRVSQLDLNSTSCPGAGKHSDRDSNAGELGWLRSKTAAFFHCRDPFIFIFSGLHRNVFNLRSLATPGETVAIAVRINSMGLLVPDA